MPTDWRRLADKIVFIYNSIINHLINCSIPNPIGLISCQIVDSQTNLYQNWIKLLAEDITNNKNPFLHWLSQLLINGVWMIINPAHAIHHYPTREDNLLVCDSYIDASYMVAFFYPIVLIVICTIYAILTRKIPEAFNESKHIGEYVIPVLF